jgi:hypothetical protein
MAALILLTLLLPFSVRAAPQIPGVPGYVVSSDDASSTTTTTLTVNATLTVTNTYTHTVTPGLVFSASASTTASQTISFSNTTQISASTSTSTTDYPQPTHPFTMLSAREGSDVDFMPLNAAGFRFHLGGLTASYCPTTVTRNGGVCPPGDLTALFNTCEMVRFISV